MLSAIVEDSSYVPLSKTNAEELKHTVLKYHPLG